ncbi:MAG: hypothetical protein WCF39_16400 [Pseudolabrys sp.]|jgi:hypothetical protein
MPGLRTWCGSVMALCMAAAMAGPTASSTLANEPKPETAIGTPKTAPSSYRPYFVEFRSRAAATYGHMYVIYGQLNGRGEIIKSDIAGLHPAGDANDCDNCSVITWTLGHLLFVPSETGASDGDLEEKYVTARYRVMVDAATFKKVSAHINKLKTDQRVWHALLHNCVSFGNDIAGSLGLKTPTFIWMEPKDYVESLRELNGGKPQKPLRFAAPASAEKQPTARLATHSQVGGTASGAAR